MKGGRPRAPDSRCRWPTVGRFFVALLLVAGAVRAQSAEPVLLTEAEVVRRALGRAALQDAISGEVEAARGRAVGERALPGIQFAYLREQTFGAQGTGEDYLSVSQSFDLGNRRGARGEAGERRARAVALEGASERLRAASEARLGFFEVVFRQARVAALRGWIERIDDATAVVGRRAQRGDAARYDHRRLERERAVATARMEVEEAALSRARARLAASLGG